MEKTEKIWLDGKVIGWDEANVHILTHTLHYGLSLFEGIRAYQRADGRTHIFRLSDHVRRIYDGAKVATLDMPFTPEEITQACVDMVRINKQSSCYIRPLVFVGDGAMGLYAMTNPTRVAIIVWPWGTYLGEDGLNKGIRAKVSSFTKLHVNANMVKAKIGGQYVNAILAKREVVRSGYDEAILLDAEGYACEASGENLFVVRDGVLRTPPDGAAQLNGITRESVIELAQSLGIPVKEERMTRDFLYIADEIFLTGTAAEITPVRELDNRVIGSGKPGPITKRIQDLFFDIVTGSHDGYHKWLHWV
ncbi:MAG: branched-chain amino acid transaminase [Myxococcota bacterium]|jgi:branched-chain amino acid aminotransferase|nr:branched-chain amino acid transaminase [Myxococcota bacterium]